MSNSKSESVINSPFGSQDAASSFLGTGWSFPPAFIKETKNTVMISDEEDVHSSLQILLSTAIGERFLQPKYGCNLDEFVFEPMNLTTQTLLKNIVTDAILIFEPRIKLVDVILDMQFINEGRIEINIEYTIRTTNSRANMVFPFFVNEASNNL